MRHSTACAACRNRRRKCLVPPDGGICAYCSDQNIACLRAGSIHRPGSGGRIRPRPSTITSHKQSQPQPNHPLSLSPRRSSPADIPDKALTFDLVELYFTYIHDQFHSLFHRPSFILDLHRGCAPPVIVYAMLALSARFSTHPFFDGIPPTMRGEHFAFKSNALLNLREISVTTIQACVLLGAAAIVEGEAAAESVFYAAAARIANYLDLPNLPVESVLEREVNLRVYWTLCMIDVWSSAGINLPREMTRRDNVPYPMDEAVFLSLTSSSPDPATSNRESSLLAQMIKLNGILLSINDAIKTLTSPEGDAANFSSSTVPTLSARLEVWEAALPPNLRDTPENLHFHASQGLGRIFVAIYLGYYHFGQLLFYPSLDELQRQSHPSSSPTSPTPSQPHASSYAKRCKHFASSLSRIVSTANATPGCDVRYNMVGHITVVSSSVFIHTLLFSSSQPELDAARRQLEQNFEVLTGLRTYWPMLEVCFARLRTFHALCRSSMDTSFRMDRWMVRFLTEFARPVGEGEREGELGVGEGWWEVEREG
ncbi:fungal-specific transcription factor [Coniochaeta sp. 2T2.1]|nr:fungal-specific transcription factor [Coniochaeta sp. 2T2.1]